MVKLTKDEGTWIARLDGEYVARVYPAIMVPPEERTGHGYVVAMPGQYRFGGDTLREVKEEIAWRAGRRVYSNPNDTTALWRSRWQSLGPLFDPEDMTPKAIRDELNYLLFDDVAKQSYGATDPELLTIMIIKNKAHFFDFLLAGTWWPVSGRWHEYHDENMAIQVQFMDNASEAIGNRVMHLLHAYNQKVVKEELLYARIVPIEEGTLEYSAFRGVEEKDSAPVQVVEPTRQDVLAHMFKTPEEMEAIRRQIDRMREEYPQRLMAWAEEQGIEPSEMVGPAGEPKTLSRGTLKKVKQPRTTKGKLKAHREALRKR